MPPLPSRGSSITIGVDWAPLRVATKAHRLVYMSFQVCRWTLVCHSLSLSWPQSRLGTISIVLSPKLSLLRRRVHYVMVTYSETGRASRPHTTDRPSLVSTMVSRRRLAANRSRFLLWQAETTRMKTSGLVLIVIGILRRRSRSSSATHRTDKNKLRL